MPELGCHLGLVEIPYPARIIVRAAPLELPDRLGQCPVTYLRVTQPGCCRTLGVSVAASLPVSVCMM
jgi:hypothetical protein